MNSEQHSEKELRNLKETKMGKHLEKAIELRNDPNVCYNCAQAVICAFAEECGLTMEQATALGANFGGGMKRASVCGAITGGLMVLGLFGVDDGPAVADYHRRLRESHDGLLDCADLLRVNKERGGDRAAHCDGMISECISLVESILRERGKL